MNNNHQHVQLGAQLPVSALTVRYSLVQLILKSRAQTCQTLFMIRTITLVSFFQAFLMRRYQQFYERITVIIKRPSNVLPDL